MKGLSLLIYTILFTFIFFVDQSAFLQMAGAMRGVPAQVDYQAKQIAEDISYGSTVTTPANMQVFISDCIYPTHEKLTTEGQEAAVYSCQNAVGVICLFYDYFGYVYTACQGMLFTPDKTYFEDATDKVTIYTVERNLEERTFSLTPAGLSN